MRNRVTAAHATVALTAAAVLALSGCGSSTDTGTAATATSSAPTPSSSAPSPSAPSPTDPATPTQSTPEPSSAAPTSAGPGYEVGKVRCSKPSGDTVECVVPITNTSGAMRWMSSDMAMRDADGVRLESDGRFQEYVADGETYLARHFGPVETVSGEIIDVTLDEVMQIVTDDVQEGEDGYLLPVNNASLGACTASGDSLQCEATVTNTGPVQGTIVTTVAFYDGKGVRLETDSRFEEAVAPGEKVKQQFYGPGKAKTVTVLEVELATTW